MIKMCILLGGIFVHVICNAVPQKDLQIVQNGKSNYQIILPIEATNTEKKAAAILQQYIQQISSCKLKIASERLGLTNTNIYIGKTDRANTFNSKKIEGEGFYIATNNDAVIIKGGQGQGVVYGVYALLEKYLGCRKFSASPAFVPQTKNLTITASVFDFETPSMTYRQVYYPASNDAEYIEWHKLHKFEYLWGLWGHSFDKLVSPQQYFNTHSEYFSLNNGKRTPAQLCLSNKDVFNITVAYFKKAITANPNAIYWSISPNDAAGYCTCDQCAKTDAEEGSPSGSLIQFVNRVARQFPNCLFTTLAYTYTSHAPKNLRPANNVYILLSSIDAYRNRPLRDEPTAAGFRNNLAEWLKLTDNIFVWDYTTQFTNYLAPFPDIHTYAANFDLFAQSSVKGLLSQGSGDTYSDFAELKSYLLAKLTWNAKADVKALTKEFCNGYYGAAAPYILLYLNQLQFEVSKSGKPLDIYENPINEYNSFLSPQLIDQYSVLLDKAEAAVESNQEILHRVKAVRLGLEYTVLQQSRFFGQEKFGFLKPGNQEEYVIKENWPKRIEYFVETAKQAGVTELSEGGRHPNEYKAEWNTIFTTPWKKNKALHTAVNLLYPFAPEYPAKGNRTLVDGVPGYKDFSYNWLVFYEKDMVATIDLGTEKIINTIQVNFLYDPRHWIFLPANIQVEVSENGKEYKLLNKRYNNRLEENYTVSIDVYSLHLPQPIKTRFIRVTAKNRHELPAWRFRTNKKPSICCDEIYIL